MNQRLIESCDPLRLRQTIDAFAPQKILLVTGKKSYTSSGAQNFIETATSDYKVVRFPNFDKNINYENLLENLTKHKKTTFDLVIAIGGGSVIDMAKLLNSFHQNLLPTKIPPEQLSAHIQKPSAPLIAIPTTAGSGSEATHFATLYHQAKKHSIAHPFLLPTVALINHQLSARHTGYAGACAQLDALAQAIESTWSNGTNEQSHQDAARAISLIHKNSQQKNNPTNSESIAKNQALAAYLAGRAINTSKTTAAHALSYTLTIHHGLPHGHAVFLSLPNLLRYNAKITTDDCCHPLGAAFVQQQIESICTLLGTENAEQAAQQLEILAQKNGLELSLQALKIPPDQLAKNLAQSVNSERLANNPRKILPDQLIDFFQK